MNKLAATTLVRIARCRELERAGAGSQTSPQRVAESGNSLHLLRLSMSGSDASQM
jgi:hypothetical protein